MKDFVLVNGIESEWGHYIVYSPTSKRLPYQSEFLDSAQSFGTFPEVTAFLFGKVISHDEDAQGYPARTPTRDPHQEGSIVVSSIEVVDGRYIVYTPGEHRMPYMKEHSYNRRVFDTFCQAMEYVFGLLHTPAK